MSEIWVLDYIHHTVTSVIVRSIPCVSHVSCKVWAIFWWHFKILWQFRTLFIIVCAFQKKKKTSPPKNTNPNKMPTVCMQHFPWKFETDRMICFLAMFLCVPEIIEKKFFTSLYRWWSHPSPISSSFVLWLTHMCKLHCAQGWAQSEHPGFWALL